MKNIFLIRRSKTFLTGGIDDVFISRLVRWVVQVLGSAAADPALVEGDLPTWNPLMDRDDAGGPA